MNNINAFGLKSLYSRAETFSSTEVIRKTTIKNLEFTMAALILTINLLGASWGPPAVSKLSELFVSVLSSAQTNPIVLIGDLKVAVHKVIDWAREPRLYGDLNTLRRTLIDEGENNFTIELILLYETLHPSPSETVNIPLLRILVGFGSLHRVIVTPAKPNYSSITDKGTFTIDPSWTTELTTSIQAFGIDPSGFQKDLRAAYKNSKYILSSKAGPNGHAMMDAQLDGAALIANPGVYGAFVSYAEFFKQGNRVDEMLRTIDLRGSAVPLMTAKLGRLVPIEEWGGKTRVVAILDYWTQALLDPLHRVLGSVLRNIPMDGTYEQLEQVRRVKEATGSGKATVYSYDLSNATDRFPISIQERVLGILLGNEGVAANWSKLLTGRPYTTHDGGIVHYSVGQPMGAKSSFVIFALTHHLIIQKAARDGGWTGVFLDYAIIGDDVTIWNTQVAEAYEKLMKTLGVNIAADKSWVHRSSARPVGELAKRIFLEGSELSSFPVKLIAKTGQNPLNSVRVQEVAMERELFSDVASGLKLASGLVDTETRSRLMVMNALPSEVTGISKPYGPYTDNLQLNKMYPGSLITESDVIEAYLFSAVVEQIKRLDALLKESELVNQAILEQARVPLFLIPQTGLPETSKAKVQKLRDGLPQLSSFHPLVSATISEVERITALLAALRSGETTLSASAKRQILDAFRNPLVDVVFPKWDDDEGIPAFSLVNRALTNMDTMFLDKGGKTLDFSLMLLSLRRHFTVTWIRGRGVFVNSIRTKVEQSVTNLESGLTTTASSVSLSPRAQRASQAAVADQKRVERAQKAVSGGSPGR